MNTDRLAAVYQRLVEECWHQGRYDNLEHLLSADYDRDDRAITGVRGHEGYVALVEECRRAFADLRYEVTSIVGTGSRRAFNFNISGVHVAPFRGIAPARGTQRAMRVDGMSLVDFDGQGRIVRSSVVWDFDELQRQLLGGHMLRVRDTELYVVRAGQGPLFLTLHGGPGFDHTYLRPWLDPLASQAEVVWVDLRGQGRSRRLVADEWEAVTHATFVADIDALHARFERKPMVLFGHSYGAYLALDYALAHPDRLAALIICNGAPNFAHGAQVMANAMARDPVRGAAFAQALASPVPDDATYARDFPGLAPLYFHKNDGALAESVMARTSYSAGALNHGFGRLLPEWDVEARLGEISVPTLVIAGDDDFVTPASPCSEKLAAGIPNATLEVIRDAGHFPFVEGQEQFLDAVRAFLRKTVA